jgi:DNA (cytosine-5)-methyltransferase 1
MSFKALDLFAGCGGLSSGLTEAGLDVKWANEFWKPAADTYRKIHRQTTLYEEDAIDLLARVLRSKDGIPSQGDVDVIAGGPPCQGFSGFNRHRQPNDPRNSLMEVFLRFVDFLRPKLILIENVPGMLTIDSGRMADILLSTLQSMGYTPKVGLLQAGYYGLPQNRWRTFVFATSGDVALPKFPEPTHGFERIIIHGSSSIRVPAEIIVPPKEPDLFWDPLPKTTVGNAISDLPGKTQEDLTSTSSYEKSANSEYQRLLRNGKKSVTDHVSPNVKEITLKRIRAVPRKPGAGWLDLPDELKPKNLKRHGDNRYANRYGRLDWNGVFNTILSRPHPYWSRIIHPEEDRLLSVRECARAQGLKDSVEFTGPLTARYKQVGNAVPPPLAKKIGEMILDVL